MLPSPCGLKTLPAGAGLLPAGAGCLLVRDRGLPAGAGRSGFCVVRPLVRAPLLFTKERVIVKVWPVCGPPAARRAFFLERRKTLLHGGLGARHGRKLANGSEKPRARG